MRSHIRVSQATLFGLCLGSLDSSLRRADAVIDGAPAVRQVALEVLENPADQPAGESGQRRDRPDQPNNWIRHSCDQLHAGAVGRHHRPPQLARGWGGQEEGESLAPLVS